MANLGIGRIAYRRDTSTTTAILDKSIFQGVNLGLLTYQTSPSLPGMR